MSLLVDPILSLVDTAYVGRGLGAISLAALGKLFVRFVPCLALLLLAESWATPVGV